MDPDPPPPPPTPASLEACPPWVRDALSLAPSILLIHEAATILRVDVQTLRRWGREGTARVLLYGGRHSIPRLEVARLLQSRAGDLPPSAS